MDNSGDRTRSGTQHNPKNFAHSRKMTKQIKWKVLRRHCVFPPFCVFLFFFFVVMVAFFPLVLIFDQPLIININPWSDRWGTHDSISTDWNRTIFAYVPGLTTSVTIFGLRARAIAAHVTYLTTIETLLISATIPGQMTDSATCVASSHSSSPSSPARIRLVSGLISAKLSAFTREMTGSTTFKTIGILLGTISTQVSWITTGVTALGYRWIQTILRDMTRSAAVVTTWGTSLGACGG